MDLMANISPSRVRDLSYIDFGLIVGDLKRAVLQKTQGVNDMYKYNPADIDQNIIFHSFECLICFVLHCSSKNESERERAGRE